MKTFSLENNAALVTGSSQGIGFAIANALREAGAKLISHGLPARPEYIPSHSPYLSHDLAQPDAPARLIADAFAAQPGLDTLVCHAGSFCCFAGRAVPTGWDFRRTSRSFFWTCSTRRTIFTFDDHRATGGLSDERVFYEAPPAAIHRAIVVP